MFFILYILFDMYGSHQCVILNFFFQFLHFGTNSPNEPNTCIHLASWWEVDVFEVVRWFLQISLCRIIMRRKNMKSLKNKQTNHTFKIACSKF